MTTLLWKVSQSSISTVKHSKTCKQGSIGNQSGAYRPTSTAPSPLVIIRPSPLPLIGHKKAPRWGFLGQLRMRYGAPSFRLISRLQLLQKYIPEHYAVREVLMGLQNFENLMFTWADSGEHMFSYQVLELPLTLTDVGVTDTHP